MASAIEDPSELPGENLCDQDGAKIGEIKHVYGIGDGEEPMWVEVEMSTGLGRSRAVFVPMARIKEDHGDIRVPYSGQHLLGSPEVEADGTISEADDQALRSYYAIGAGDQELRTDNDSYASQVPDGEGEAQRLEG